MGPAARFIYHLPPDVWRTAVEYARIRYALYFLSVAWSIAVLAGLIGWRVAPRLRDFAERRTRRCWAQAALFVPPLLLLLAVLELPFGIYRHHLAVYYKQSVAGWGVWFADWAKEQAIAVLVGTAVLWLLYALIRRSPRRWWLWFWLCLQPMMLAGVFLEPLLIDPLFCEIRPLRQAHPALAKELEKLTAHAGEPIAPNRMFEMLASAKTRSLNAYVTGIGPSKRVVIFDTLLQQEGPEQVLSTFGHELGHYALGHIPQSMAVAAGATLLGLWAGWWLAGRVLAAGGRWGVRGPGDWASLPVFLLLLALAGFLSAPLENAYSRQEEGEADLYSLRVNAGVVADPGKASAESFQREGELNLADPAPPPFIEFWLYSHPPVADRIRVAAQFDPARGR